MTANGGGKRPSQCSRESSDPVKEDEQSWFATPQLSFVLKEVSWREAIDIMVCDGLRKAIVEETHWMVNDGVVHLVLQQPEGIEYLRR